MLDAMTPLKTAASKTTRGGILKGLPSSHSIKEMNESQSNMSQFSSRKRQKAYDSFYQLPNVRTKSKNSMMQSTSGFNESTDVNLRDKAFTPKGDMRIIDE